MKKNELIINVFLPVIALTVITFSFIYQLIKKTPMLFIIVATLSIIAGLFLLIKFIKERKH